MIKKKNFDCEGIIRHGLNKYTDEVGRLWVALANFYIRQGLFEKARDIFEEALSKVLTARDFGLVFNSYLKFEETLINNLIEENEEEKEKRQIEEKFEKLVKETFNNLKIQDDNEMIIDDQASNQEKELDKLALNMKLFRLENLIERRPFLLSDALLRQNPNNVHEWLNRVKICKGDKELIIKTYEKALATVEILKAYGRPELLFINYAKFYDEIGLLDKANEVFYRGTQSEFKSIDQITNIWCEWAEMHLSNNNYEDAYVIVKKGCTTTKQKDTDDNNYQRKYISGSLSLKLWSFYADLEEQLGVFENVKVYTF